MNHSLLHRTMRVPDSAVRGFMLFCAFIIILPLAAHAQAPATVWSQTLGGSADDIPVDIVRTSDGGSLVLSHSNSIDGDITNPRGDSDYWLAKLDATGNLEWQKSYGGPHIDRASALVAAGNGDFFLVGYTYSTTGDVTGHHGGTDVWVIRVTAAGNIVWQKTFGGSLDDMAFGAAGLPNGELAIAVYSRSVDGDVSGNHGGGDFWLLRINGTGGIVSQKCYGGTNVDCAFGIAAAADGGVFMTGYSWSTDGDAAGNPVPTARRPWTIKTAADGTLQWQRYGQLAVGDMCGQKLTALADGCAVVGYKSFNPFFDGPDLWLARYDQNGNKIWENTYGDNGPNLGYSVNIGTDGAFLVTGKTQRNGTDGVTRGVGNLWLMKIGMFGSVVWEKIMGGTYDEEATGLVVHPDGSMVLIGASASLDGDITGAHGSRDVWVAKLAVDPALPVSLVSFDAKCRDNASVELTWTTASEIDNAYFEIEKTKDLKTLETVAKVMPDAGPATTHSYRHTDEMPYQGTSYYRLKQVDTDGTITRYPWQVVVVNQTYAAFPNPASQGAFRVRLDEPGTASIDLHDTQGRPVRIEQFSRGGNLVDIKLPGTHAPGAYVLTVTERGQKRTYKLVID